MDNASPAPELSESRAEKYVWFDWLMIVAAAAAVLLFVFLPLVIISASTQELGSVQTGAEAAVGAAVLLRVAARRVFRSAARNLMQTVIGAFSRTTTRTITRRVVRMAVKSAAFSAKEGLTANATDDSLPQQSPLIAVATGFGGLFLSFWGILYFSDSALTAPLTEKLSPPLAALLAALPLLIFAALIRGATAITGVEARFHTAMDGLLLQGYFTGAGSFLPLTTDVEYHGPAKATGRTAAIVLAGLLVLHWLLFALGQATGSFACEFSASLVLVYGFVYSFPLHPLDGYYLFSSNRWLWAVYFAVMLISFVRNVSDVFQNIL